MDLLDLVAKVKLDSTEYEKGLSSATSSAKDFASTVTSMGSSIASIGWSALTTGLSAVTSGVEAATSAFASGIISVTEYGDNIDKTSQKVGMSYESYQQWDYIMNLAGTSMSNCSIGMKTLTNQIDNAKTGTQDAIDNFSQLNISLEDLNNMSREEVFAAVINGMQNMEDSTERAALANDLFGRSGQEMTPLFNMTNEELNEAIDNFERYNMALSDEGVEAAADCKDSIYTLKGAFSGLKNNMMSEFLPAVTTVMAGITELVAGDSDTGIAQINEGVDDFIDQLSESAEDASTVGRKLITSLITELSEHSEDIMTAGAETIITLTEAIANALPNIVESAWNVIEKLGDALIDKAPDLAESGHKLLEKISTGLTEHADDLANGAVTLITMLADFISNNVNLLVTTAVTIVTTLITTLTEPSNLSMMINAGITLITAIADALLNNLAVLIDVIPDIIENFVEFFADSENLDQIVEGVVKLFSTVSEALPDIIEALQDVIIAVVDALVEYLTGDGAVNMLMAVSQITIALVAAIVSCGTEIINKQVLFISELIDKIIGGGDDMEGAGKSLLERLQDGFLAIFEAIGPWIKEKITSLVDIIKGKVEDFKTAGKNLMEGLAEGIKNAASTAVTSMTGAAGLVINAAKTKFDENSPSKVFYDIGEYLVEGLEEGWEENIDDVNKTIDNGMKYEADLNTNLSTNTITKASTLSDSDINRLAAALSVNVNNVTYLDGKEIGESTYSYVKEKTTDDKRALNLATGGAYNV